MENTLWTFNIRVLGVGVYWRKYGPVIGLILIENVLNTAGSNDWNGFFHHLQFVVGSVAATPILKLKHTVYPKTYAHGFVVLCFVVVTQSFIMNSHEVFIHIHQGCFAGTGAIVKLAQCQWSKYDGYGKISRCITTTKHSKAKTVCIFLVIYCILQGTGDWKI